MRVTDINDPIFVMQGARAAIADGLLHIEEQVKALEQAVTDNPGLAFDLAKTLIESACRTILTERRIPFDKDDNLPKLYKVATQMIPFLIISWVVVIIASYKFSVKALEKAGKL